MAAEFSPTPMSPGLLARYQPEPVLERPYSPTDTVHTMSDEEDMDDDYSSVIISDISMYDYDPDEDDGLCS